MDSGRRTAPAAGLCTRAHSSPLFSRLLCRILPKMHPAIALQDRKMKQTCSTVRHETHAARFGTPLPWLRVHSAPLTSLLCPFLSCGPLRFQGLRRSLVPPALPTQTDSSTCQWEPQRSAGGCDSCDGYLPLFSACRSPHQSTTHRCHMHPLSHSPLFCSCGVLRWARVCWSARLSVKFSSPLIILSSHRRFAS